MIVPLTTPRMMHSGSCFIRRQADHGLFSGGLRESTSIIQIIHSWKTWQLPHPSPQDKVMGRMRHAEKLQFGVTHDQPFTIPFFLGGGGWGGKGRCESWWWAKGFKKRKREKENSLPNQKRRRTAWLLDTIPAPTQDKLLELVNVPKWSPLSSSFVP